MREGRLSLPKASEKVEVVYITPRFICTSRHAIKIYADKLLKRRLSWSIGGISLSVFLTTAPLAFTEQKFTDTWFASAETIQVLMPLAAYVSMACMVGSMLFCLLNWNKANSDYMIQELMQDEDSLERTSQTDERNATIPMDSFLGIRIRWLIDLLLNNFSHRIFWLTKRIFCSTVLLSHEEKCDRAWKPVLYNRHDVPQFCGTFVCRLRS